MNHPIRILLVDDSPYFLEAARDFLSYQEALTVVGVAREGSQALAQLQDLEPDIILLDLNLADASGLKLIPVFKERLPQAKIIVLTMMEESSYRAAAMQAGADGFVHKATMSKTLLSTIAKIVERGNSPENAEFDAQSPQDVDPNESRFLRLAEHFPDLMYRYEFSPKRGFTYVSPSAAAMTGYTPEDHYADPDLGFKIIHPEDRHLHQDLMEGRADMQKPLELRWIRRDGSVFWAEQRNVPIYDAGGTLVACEGVARNITERKQAEEELRLSDVRYRSLFEQSNDAVFILDLQGNHLKANRRAAEMLGYRIEEIQHLSFRDLSAELEKSEQVLKRLLAGEQIPTFERLFRKKNGEIFPVEINVELVRDEKGHPLHIQSVVRDISDRKRIEAKLHESQAQLAGIVHSTMDALITIDEDHRITLFNPAAEQMFKCPSSEAVGSPLERFIPEAVRGKHRDFVRGFGSSGETRRMMQTPTLDLNCLRADGTMFPGEISLSQFEANGRKTFIASIRDITERKRAETEIRRRNEDLSLLVSVNQALNRGESLADILALISDRLREIFEGHGASIYLLDASRRRLVNQHMPLSADILAQIEKLTRVSTPRLELDLQGKHPFRGVFETKKIQVMNDPRAINAHFASFADTLELPAALRAAAKKAMPLVRQLVGAQSDMIVPLVSNGEVLGVIDMVNRVPFTEEDAERMEHIAGQLTVAIQRKQAEEDLRQAEEKYRVLAEAAHDLITLIDAHGRIVYTNSYAAAQFDQPAHQLIGRRVTDIFPPDVAARQQANIQKVLSTGEPLYIEAPVRFRSELVWLSTWLTPVENGRGVLIVSRDITERKLAEAEIRRVKEFNQTLLDNMSEGIVVQNTDGNFVFANPAALRITGYSPEEFIGAHWTKFFPEDQHEAIRQADELRASGKASQYELEFLHRDGRRINLLVSGSPMFEHGRFNGSMAVFTDITERKRAEERIQRQMNYLTALAGIDRVILSGLDMRVTLDFIAARAASLLNADAVSVLILDQSRGALEYGAGVGFHTDAVHTASVGLGASYAGKAAVERRTVQIPDLTKEPHNLFSHGFLKDEKFVSYYGAPLIVKGRVVGVLEAFHRSPATRDEEWLDFLGALAGQTAIAIDNAKMFENMQNANTELSLAYEATIEGWSRAMDLRDRETEGHTQRVTALTLQLAESLNLPRGELIHIRRGALLHDIGKMGVPDQILLKAGALTEEEWAIMRRHPQFAYDMLSSIDYLQPALDIPYCHHEKWDGSGYPRGLKGEEIPLAARIFAVVDVWDALTSDRPYRPAWSREKALEYIREQSGKHFDPQVVEAFLEMMEQPRTG